MPNIIQYLRAENDGQNVQSQLDQLKAAGAIKIVQKSLPVRNATGRSWTT